MLTNTFGRGRATAPLRLVAAIAAALLAAVFLAACSSNSDGSGDGATGSAGSEATSASESKNLRVVALDWRYEEILEALGVKPVGIVEIGKSAGPTTLEGKLDGITSVGEAKQPNLEVIQSLHPDLILASPSRHASIMPQLEQIAETESYSDATYSDVLDSMDQIAEKLGKQDEAKQVRERIEHKIDDAKAVVPQGTRAAVAGWSSQMLYTWIGNSFPASLLTAAGYTYGYEGERSNIESKTDVAELTGDKIADMKLDKVYMYKDVDEFKTTPYAQAVPQIIDVDQDIWSRARGPLSAESMLDTIIETEK